MHRISTSTLLSYIFQCFEFLYYISEISEWDIPIPQEDY